MLHGEGAEKLRALSLCAGYGRFGGPRASADELNQIFGIMEQNELLRPDRLLTGLHRLDCTVKV